MTANEARKRAKEICRKLQAYNEGLIQYTLGQLWWAVLEAKTTNPDFVALALLDPIMRGEAPPEALQVYGHGYDGFERWAAEQDRCGVGWSYYDVARNFKQAQVIGQQWHDAWRREYPR